MSSVCCKAKEVVIDFIFVVMPRSEMGETTLVDEVLEREPSSIVGFQFSNPGN